MNQSLQNLILKQTISTFSHSHQIRKAVEEMAELIKALSKYETATEEGNLSAEHMFNIVDEIADLEIMIPQLKMIFNCGKAVETRRLMKLERLAKTLDKVIYDGE